MGIKTIIWLERGLKDCLWKAGDLEAQLADGPVAANALDFVEAALGLVGEFELFGKVGESKSVREVRATWQRLWRQCLHNFRVDEIELSETVELTPMSAVADC